MGLIDIDKIWKGVEETSKVTVSAVDKSVKNIFNLYSALASGDKDKVAGIATSAVTGTAKSTAKTASAFTAFVKKTSDKVSSEVDKIKFVTETPPQNNKELFDLYEDTYNAVRKSFYGEIIDRTNYFVEYHIYDEIAQIYEKRARSALEKAELFSDNNVRKYIPDGRNSIDLMNNMEIWVGAAADSFKARICDISDKIDNICSEAYRHFMDDYNWYTDLSKTYAGYANNAYAQYTSDDHNAERTDAGKKAIDTIRKNIERKA